MLFVVCRWISCRLGGSVCVFWVCVAGLRVTLWVGGGNLCCLQV